MGDTGASGGMSPRRPQTRVRSGAYLGGRAEKSNRWTESSTVLDSSDADPIRFYARIQESNPTPRLDGPGRFGQSTANCLWSPRPIWSRTTVPSPRPCCWQWSRPCGRLWSPEQPPGRIPGCTRHWNSGFRGALHTCAVERI